MSGQEGRVRPGRLDSDITEGALEDRPEAGLRVVDVAEGAATVQCAEESATQPRVLGSRSEDRQSEEHAVRREHLRDVLDRSALALHRTGEAVDDAADRRGVERS